MSEGASSLNRVPAEGETDNPASTASFALALLSGLAFGATAQYLRQKGGALASLGGATAPWITGGYLLSLRVARSKALVNGAVWAGAVLATYLLGWLFSYHAAYAIRESVSGAMAWNDARTFVVAVTPVCIVLGSIAAFSYREGVLGDLCLSLPLAWSLPEAYRAVGRGWTYVIAVTIPTIFVSILPFFVVRNRKRNAYVIVVGVLVTALLFYLSYQPLSDYFNRT
jgi:hypothetical protein